MVPTKLDVTDITGGKARVVATFAAEDVSKVFVVVRRAIAYAAQVDSMSDLDLPALLREKIGDEKLGNMYADGVASILAAWTINSLDFQTILEPTIERLGQPIEGAEFTVLLTVTRKPAFELSDYGPVSIARKSFPISDEDVNGYIAQLAEDASELVDVSQGERVKSGDHVIVDIRTSREGAPVPELTENGRAFDIGEGWFSRTFDENVIGMRVGETKTFQFEALDSTSKDASDTVVFTTTVTLLRVQTRKTHEITDEWVSNNIEGAASVEDLKRLIRSKIAQDRSAAEERELLGPVADALAERLEMHISDEELEFTINEFLRQNEANAQQQGIDLVSYFANQGLEGEDLNEFLMKSARKKIMRGYALDAYYRHENMQIGEDDIDLVLREMNGAGRSLSVDALHREYQQGGRMYILREAAERLKANRVAASRAIIC